MIINTVNGGCQVQWTTLKPLTIEYHYSIVAFFLRFFNKSFQVEDRNGDTWNLNTNSTIEWLRTNGINDTDIKVQGVRQCFIDTVYKNQKSVVFAGTSTCLAVQEMRGHLDLPACKEITEENLEKNLEKYKQGNDIFCVMVCTGNRYYRSLLDKSKKYVEAFGEKRVVVILVGKEKSEFDYMKKKLKMNNIPDILVHWKIAVREGSEKLVDDTFQALVDKIKGYNNVHSSLHPESPNSASLNF